MSRRAAYYDIPISRLHELFVHEASTGRLIRRVSVWRNLAGTEAGSLNNHGYLKVKIAQKMVTVHRVVWAMHHGKWPTGVIDHINHDKTDNRIENLRECDIRTNVHNSSMRRDNSTGIRGAYLTRAGRWEAKIMADGKVYHLGQFDTGEEAGVAYSKAKGALHVGSQ